jgi:anti-sigma-K factor RskA
MKYDDPRLRDLLAGEYVMATLPPRARARFERLMASDPALARLVADWQARLAPIDATAPPVEPPVQIWHAVERAIAPPTVVARRRPAPSRWWDGLALWRGIAIGALAVAAALVLYIAVPHINVPRPLPPSPVILAVLADASGTPSFAATRLADGRIAVAAIRAQPLAADRALELWAIAGGPPKSLGLVGPVAGRGIVLPAAALPREGVLAVSLEPAGGSPTGTPTGPVLYQGKILPAES